MDPMQRIAFDATFYSLCTIFLILRFAQRLTPSSLKRIREYPSVPALLADFFMFLTLACTTSSIGLDIWLQRRTILLSSDFKYFGELLQLYTTGMQIMFAGQIFWAVVMWSVKAALMGLYYDIARHVTDKVKRLMHLTCAVLLATFLSVIITSFTWCRPLKTNWTLGPELCSPQTSVFPVAFTSVLHIITDMMVLGIPLLILRTLHLQRAQVVAVYFVFGIGFLAFSVALVSFALQIQIVRIDSHSPSYLVDLEIKAERVYLAGTAECSIAIVGACLPSLRVFLRMLSKPKNGQGKKISGGVRKEKDSKGSSNGGSNWSAAPLMMRPGGGFHGSGFNASRSGSPAPAATRIDFNQKPTSIRENLKKPLLAVVGSAFGRTNGSVAKVDTATGGERLVNDTVSRRPSVDSLMMDGSEDTQAQHIPNPQSTVAQEGFTYNQPDRDVEAGHEDVGIAVTNAGSDKSVQQPMPTRLPIAQPYGHQRTWSGAGAPAAIPLSYSPDHWR